MTWGRVLVWIVLGVSLFANAVVLGLWMRVAAFSDGAGLPSGWADVPAETRGYLRSELKENRGQLRALLADLRSARSDMLAAAAARPYDRAAVEAAQARVREASAALQVQVQKLMLAAFDKAAATGP